MNSAAVEPDGWSRPRWVGAFLVIVVLHALLLFILSDNEPAPRRMASRLSNIYFVADPASDVRLAPWLSLQDPLVFVQPKPQNVARMNLSGHSHFSYELTNWTEPYRWLAPADQYFADDFTAYVASAVRPSTLLSQKPTPMLSKIVASTPSLPGHAVLRIEGDLARRHLVSALPLPVNETSAILTNTVVRIVVDSAGETLSAALILGSGSSKADQSALGFARRARFDKGPNAPHTTRTANDGNLTSGQLVFQWFPMTNDAKQISAKP